MAIWVVSNAKLLWTNCYEHFAVQVFLWKSVFIPLGYLLRSGITESYLYFHKKQSIFHSDCTIWHSYQQCLRDLFVPHPCQPLVFLLAILWLRSSNSLWFILAFPWWMMVTIFCFFFFLPAIYLLWSVCSNIFPGTMRLSLSLFILKAQNKYTHTLLCPSHIWPSPGPRHTLHLPSAWIHTLPSR